MLRESCIGHHGDVKNDHHKPALDVSLDTVEHPAGHNQIRNEAKCHTANQITWELFSTQASEITKQCKCGKVCCSACLASYRNR